MLSVAPCHQATSISRLTDDGRKSRALEHILPKFAALTSCYQMQSCICLTPSYGTGLFPVYLHGHNGPQCAHPHLRGYPNPTTFSTTYFHAKILNDSCSFRHFWSTGYNISSFPRKIVHHYTDHHITLLASTSAIPCRSSVPSGH